MPVGSDPRQSRVDAASPLRFAAAPPVEQLGLGSVLGFSTGKALRIGGRAGAALVGGSFIFLQTLSHFGYVTVDWTKTRNDYNAVFDRDGDGRFTESDVRLLLSDAQSALSCGLPAGGAFMAGVTAGVGGGVKTAGLLMGASAVSLAALPGLLKMLPSEDLKEVDDSFWNDGVVGGNQRLRIRDRD